VRLITGHHIHLKKIATVLFFSTSAHASTCDKPIYLTFDTGNMDVAEYVVGVLKKHDVKATFFWPMKKLSAVITPWMIPGRNSGSH